MNQIVVFNQKGGVGKSTSVVNIAGSLSKTHNKRVLIIDLDSQATSTDYLIADSCFNGFYLSDYLENKASNIEILNNVSFKIKNEMIDTNIRIICADDKLDAIEISNEYIFKDLVDSYKDDFDFIIYDCPGYLNQYTIAALCSATHVLIPAFADLDSLKGFSKLTETIDNIRTGGYNTLLEVLGVFFTCYQKRLSVGNQLLELCRAEMGELVFDTTIRRAAVVLDSRAIGRPMSYYKPNDLVALDYDNLTREIIDKINRRGE